MKRLFLFSTFILSLFLLLIVGSSTALLGSDLEELAEVEHVLSREDYFYQMRSYPFKDIPEGARLRALKQLERGMKLHKLEALQSREWQPIGPAVVPNGQPFDLQRSARIPVSGRATSVLVDPKNPSRIFLGTAQGGVWRSIDAGVSWTPITDNLPSLAVGALAMDPQNPAIIYVGTGEAHFSGNSYYGAGVFKSTDGGESWNATGDLPLRARISSIVIDPINTRNVYAVTALSASGQPADAGIFKSTNGGASWQKSLDGSATDLSIDPVSPSTLVAAIGFPVGSSLNGLYKSVDGGANWRLTRTVPNGTSTGRIELARAASSPNMMFASISNPNPFTLMNLYRSNDGGENWTIVAGAPDYCGAQCFYNNVLRVDPQNPSVVYLGGVPLFRSTDGGVSFQEVSTPQQFGFGLHADVHDIAFSPNDTSTIFVACDGGIFRSQDRGNSWLPLNNGISTLQFQSVALDSTDPRRAIGGTQDNGTLLYTGSPVWSLIDFGDGGDTAIDFQSPLIFYHYYFRLFFARSDDGGNTFSLKIDGLPISSSGATTERTLFYAPLTMDSVNPSLLYTGAQKLYKTINRAETWSAVSGDLTNGSGAISAISVSPSDPRTIFVGSSDAKVSKTDDGGISWQTVTMGLPNRAVTRVAIDPTNSQLVYVTFSGFGTGHVFKSLNGGLTWIDVSDNLPDIPVNAAAIDPNRPNNLYIGTDIGVFQSSTGGGNWRFLAAGFPRVAVFDLEANKQTKLLVAATHGRGMFALALDGEDDAVLPQVNLEFPQGGQSFRSNDAVNIRWSASDNIGLDRQEIGLSTDGGKTFPISIASGLGANERSFVWTVPDLSTTSARIRILVRDKAGNEANSTGNDFTISQTPATTITRVQLNNGKLIIDGTAFVVNDTVIEIDDRRLGTTKYPKKFRQPDGTTTRLQGLDGQLGQLLRPGRRVSISLVSQSTGRRLVSVDFTP